jgi:hypothetical protein
MSYLLVLGLALFSSASGALLVTLLHMARRGLLRSSPPPETNSGSAQESFK